MRRSSVKENYPQMNSQSGRKKQPSYGMSSSAAIGQPSVSSILPRRFSGINTQQSRQTMSSNRLSGTAGRKSFVPRPSAVSQSVQLSARKLSGQYGWTNTGGQQMKDTRPLNDKQYMNKCIKEILEFLKEDGYTHNITVKMLMTPTSKDFFRIFEYTYVCIEEGYQLPNKGLDEEIPRILKLLGYPFTLNKSMLLNVGTPHTWPTVLGALHWLVSLVMYWKTIDINTIIFGNQLEDDPSNTDFVHSLFDYCEGTYGAFLDGADTFDSFDDEIRVLLEEQNQSLNIEQLRFKNQQLRDELIDLEQQPCPLTLEKQAYEAVSTDFETYQQYLMNLGQYQNNLEQRLEELTKTKDSLDLEYRGQLEEQKHLLAILENQEFNSLDCEKMKLEQKTVQEAVESNETANKKLDREIWDLEMQTAKKREDSDQVIQDYNSLAQQMQAHCVELKSRPDLEIQHNFDTEISVRDPIKDFYLDLKSKMASEVSKAEGYLFSKEETFDNLKDLITDHNEQIQLAEVRLVKLDDDMEKKKEVIVKSKQVLDLSDARRALTTQYEESNSELESVEQHLKDIVERAEEQSQKMKRRHEEHQQFICDLASNCLNQKSEIENKIASMLDEMRKQLPD